MADVLLEQQEVGVVPEYDTESDVDLTATAIPVGADTQALKVSTPEDRFVRIRLSQGAWACELCPGQTCKSRDTAYKHVQRSHRGCKARTKAKLRTQVAAERHAKKLSVQSSRRYRAKQRLPDAITGPAAEAGPLQDLIANVKVISCTAVVPQGAGLQRCKNRAINCQGIGTDRTCYLHRKRGKEWAQEHGGYLQGSNVVLPSTLGPAAGYGLFACVNYQPGDYMAKYEGSIVHYSHSSPLTKADMSYALQWEKNRSAIIGVRMGTITEGCGLGSLANDSNLSRIPGLRNNARFSLPDRANKCCWLIADRYVKAGNEIFVTYGPGYRLN
eukprot:TRINITY_DN6599_c0_g1_i3.p1 TRINITY_DN6599_c0_g1~~TRINITY_DN6599_c0_g1_i3.p1  ORF type:complete len:329 (+),score=5.93 TRINITY_DN6599_c0_g1_i3:77-1063(+)